MQPTKNSFQIIGGEYRGRKLHFPNLPSIRPTPSKIRETLFNWLQFESHNKTYLDLFAGTGALSFEALSRGAKGVVSVEKNWQTFQSLSKNKALLNADNLQLIHQDGLRFLAKGNPNPFDFIFLDPPFNCGLLPKSLIQLSANNFITSGSKIYIESEYRMLTSTAADNLSMPIKISQQKHTGQVYYCLLQIL